MHQISPNQERHPNPRPDAGPEASPDTGPDTGLGADQEQTPHAVRVPRELRLSAAERLVSPPHRREAARRLLESAPQHGIDLDLLWGVMEPGSDPTPKPSTRKRVRQTCLSVLGSGRTAMLFLSSPERDKSLGDTQTQVREITACIAAALDGLRDHAPKRVTLAQTLIEPKHAWAKQACAQAGMINVGHLEYMRKRVTPTDLTASPSEAWPQGVTVRAIQSLAPDHPSGDYHNLITALEGSYHDTLDCPELCGLRTMPDVIASHSATGRFDPAHWRLIFVDGQPSGCCLLSHCPHSRSVELVYLGIAPRARGMGLGRRVLAYGIGHLGALDINEVTCAVDTRNTPAIRIYESLGFAPFDARVGFVAPVSPR